MGRGNTLPRDTEPWHCLSSSRRPMTASSRHDQTVGLLLGDGAVRAVKYSVDAQVWKALGTIAG